MHFWRTQLAEIVRGNAGRVFLIDAVEGEELTYAALARRAAALALQLEARGIVRGERIGIVLPNGTLFATLYFACLLGGFTAVPVNNALPAKDRAFVLGRSRLAGLVIAENEAPPEGLTGETQVLRIGAGNGAELRPIEADDADAERGLAAIKDDQLFSIHFTSGTTNLPKGVPHKVAALLGNADAFNREFGLSRDNRFVHVMPMAYMAGFLNTLLGAFTAEASIVLAPQFSAQSVLRFWEPVARYGGDTLWVSPTMLATLTRIDRSTIGIEHCRKRAMRIFSATAPLPIKVRREFEAKYGAPVVESYGLSELLLITANLGAAGSKDGAVGRALSAARIEVRDEHGAKLTRGDGALFVRTPFATVGYLDYETGEPTPPTDDWFDTGDIGHVDGDGYVFVTGRRKDLIIRGGFNVSPRQIEEALLRHPGIEDAAVVGAPHDYYGEEIVAALIARPGHAVASLEADLRTACRRELGPTSVPDRFVAFEAFPVSSMGKVQKNKIREQIMQAAGA
jgi:acyl-CoA synthetase (AMP-forming)/AMP-acid ligase II